MYKEPRPKVMSFRATEEMMDTIKEFAAELDCSISEAINRAIEYGILYYYYNNKEN
jgi:hypothetical protein